MPEGGTCHKTKSKPLESRIIDLQQMGIEADIFLFHPYDHLGFAAMDADRDDAYIRYICARFAAFRNVWWTMADEYDLLNPKMTPGLKVRIGKESEVTRPPTHNSRLSLVTWRRTGRRPEACDDAKLSEKRLEQFLIGLNPGSFGFRGRDAMSHHRGAK